MGNKTNPTGMRLGINKYWNSIWYQPKEQYADVFLQDMKLRKAVAEKLKNASVASIVIKRDMNKITVEVRVARPGVVIGKGGAGIELLKKDLNRLVKGTVDIKVYEVKRPEIEAQLVAENVAAQCERRVSPKIAARKAMNAAIETGLIEGIQIDVSGRIRGAEIARTERVKWGKIPRQTLRNNIDYAFYEAAVPQAGKHGIRVWISKGEKLTVDTKPEN